MTEDEFRKRFDADRRDGNLTFVADDEHFDIAIGMNGPDTIILRGGVEIPMATASIVNQL